MKCDVASCETAPILYFMGVESRRVSIEKYFCEFHAHRFISEFHPRDTSIQRLRQITNEKVRVDLKLIAYYKNRRSYPASLFLDEVDGNRRVSILIDTNSWSALIGELRPREAPWPLVHAAWADTIIELGGRVEEVLLHRSLGQEWWTAQLTINWSGHSKLIKVRPSDAIVLAINQDLPILVTESAMASYSNA